MLPADTAPRQLPLDLGHHPSHAEDDFLVGAGNALAHSRILAWPHWPEAVTVLVGPPASGKSHLARIFADRSGAIAPGADGLAEIAAASDKRAVLLEDVDRIDYPEGPLFHLLNQAMRGQRTVLLTARAPVGDWNLATDDVRSRVRRAPLFRLEISDDIELSHMFVKLFADRQIKVDPRVVSYLVTRMERSPEEAARIVELMDRLALAKGSPITRTTAADALAHRQAELEARPHNWDFSDE